MSWRSAAWQVPVYVAFAVLIGYFSIAPSYRHLPDATAVVKLSFVHAGERKQPCRTRSAEELAKLAPNMRAQLDCPRERSDVRVEIDMDGKPLLRSGARASGLRHDLPSNIYRRVEIPAGEHVFSARLADTADGALRHKGEAKVDLQPGGVLVIDFVAAKGFLFRS